MSGSPLRRSSQSKPALGPQAQSGDIIDDGARIQRFGGLVICIDIPVHIYSEDNDNAFEGWYDVAKERTPVPMWTSFVIE